MDHTEILTRYTANFVDELSKNGMTDVVISPGSRSTPLAMTFVEHPKINEWIIVDERSAAFFALGLAKQTKRAIAIVCTSGTAAANYFPAIVEAHYSRVPLIVLTADRPHELRDVGAPQAIEQIKMYGDYVKWFHEMALPEATPQMLSYVRRNAARAVQTAGQGVSGPVHLNFPFREPLVPNFSLNNIWGNSREQSQFPMVDGKKSLAKNQLASLLAILQTKKRGVVVVGPQDEKNLSEVVTTFASGWGLPVLADPLSQLRSGAHAKEAIIESYDAFLRHQTIRQELAPDYIIRFGAMPVSKSYLFFVKEHKEALQFIVEPHDGFREPAGNETQFIYSDPIQFCNELIQAKEMIPTDEQWLHKWQRMNEIAKKHLLRSNEIELTEGNATRLLLENLPNESTLFVGNSMAIRDVDTFLMTTNKEISVLANRGANGIDGIVSSGVGAAASGKKVTLLLGDLSFFHDLNGLHAAKNYQIELTIVLMNNNGGGIFSFLPQSTDKKHFELLFGTPLNIDFKHVIEMYGAHYHTPTTERELVQAIHASHEQKGLTVIEVKTNRTENMKWHRNKWEKIETEILHTKW